MCGFLQTQSTHCFWSVIPLAKSPRAEAHSSTTGLNREQKRRRYVSQPQAAEYLGVTSRTIRQMISDGRLTGYRSGTKIVRVDLDELDAAMQPFGGAV
jgi:excisionase family DNA binding protein